MRLFLLLARLGFLGWALFSRSFFLSLGGLVLGFARILFDQVALGIEEAQLDVVFRRLLQVIVNNDALGRIFAGV